MITDFSLSVLRITRVEYAELADDTREALGRYAQRSWEEAGGVLCFEVASYRVDRLTGGNNGTSDS